MPLSPRHSPLEVAGACYQDAACTGHSTGITSLSKLAEPLSLVLIPHSKSDLPQRTFSLAQLMVVPFYSSSEP